MPRGGRGGKRTGKPQSAYGNRTDLHSSIAGPTPNQVYGQGVAQQQALKAVPLPASGTPPPGAAAPPPASPSAPGAPPAGPAPVLPGGLGPLHAPSGRPNEPLTAGLSSGPGPGPEVLAPPDPLTKAAAVLNTLGATADPATAALRDKINATLKNQGAA